MDHVAPAEVLCQDDGNRPMSDVRASTPSLPVTEFTAFEPDALAECALSCTPITTPPLHVVASVVVPFQSSGPIQDRFRHAPLVDSQQLRLDSTVAPVVHLQMAPTPDTKIAEVNEISVKLGFL